MKQEDLKTGMMFIHQKDNNISLYRISDIVDCISRSTGVTVRQEFYATKVGGDGLPIQVSAIHIMDHLITEQQLKMSFKNKT